ncbi:hypothetical protein K788_00005900 [Paraburkholderia caribensis MBA4]|uniref:Uncharacterized protein n=1 Tax=Paraburkholderia caribensis MBA4 TaxID=1323664 RepID=A0A0P0RHI4_9BURK|nr:hypothetical protein [Paraburkholderia caribensis]ALL67780.1 hypothetical protein K788_00005900 [Paraburkholderia caribensis MBA4]
MTDLLENIKSAFGWRTKPIEISCSLQLTDDEVSEVEALGKLTWEQTSSELWEKNSGAVSWFSPMAFCYYLPGILKCSIVDRTTGLIVVHSIMSMLDRSPNPEWWDDFFLKRWPLLTNGECKVMQEWLFWISALNNSDFDDSSIERALETMQLLIDKRAITGE